MMSRLTSFISSFPLWTSFSTVSKHNYQSLEGVYLSAKSEHALEVRTFRHKYSLVNSERTIFADDGEVGGRIVDS